MNKFDKVPKSAPIFTDGVSSVKIGLESKYAASVTNSANQVVRFFHQ